MVEACYTVVATLDDRFGDPFRNDYCMTTIESDFHKGTLDVKIWALKGAIMILMEGAEPGKDLLMNAIRFLLPLEDGRVKRLLHTFWEVMPKRDSHGHLLPEMILVCETYRKDLEHPNEYIRGSTLRFLSRLKEPQLLENLIPALRSCLHHKHWYVRRNAVMAVETIHTNFAYLIPDAGHLLATLFQNEQNSSCSNKALMALVRINPKEAEQLLITAESYPLALAHLVRKVGEVSCLHKMLQLQSRAVRYEAAGVMATMSSQHLVIVDVVSCYIKIMVEEKDDTARLIILDNLIAMNGRPQLQHPLQEKAVDMLRVLSSTKNFKVRQKVLFLVFKLVSKSNVDRVVSVLKNHLDTNDDKQYCFELIHVLVSCYFKYPCRWVMPLVPLISEFLHKDNGEKVETTILMFLKSIYDQFPKNRPDIIQNLKKADLSPIARKIADSIVKP